MRTLYLDCFSGLAGDMLVGALIDLGASLDDVRSGLEALGLDGWEVAAADVMRGPIRATKFTVSVAGHEADSFAHTSYAHDQLPARGLREIESIVGPADLPERVKSRALAAFRLLAEAEGRVHGAAPEDVHFHEVGAVDALCDIVGTALALEALGIEDVRCGPLPAGAGFVRCAHGTMPVPAPATLECLAGFDVRMEEGRGELVTPTGACLLGAIATPGAPREWTIERVGYGAGSRDPDDVPNVLRAVLGDVPTTDTEAMIELRTNVDHLPPHVLAAALDHVRSSGAVEVFTTPCTMKKGRSGHLITALVPASARGAVEDALFRETGTLGVRATRVDRRILQRAFETVSTPWGGVSVKVGRLGGRVTSREPELEDCRRLAVEHGVPVADVVAAARRG